MAALPKTGEEPRNRHGVEYGEIVAQVRSETVEPPPIDPDRPLTATGHGLADQKRLSKAYERSRALGVSLCFICRNRRLRIVRNDLFYLVWSGKRDSNPRPSAWEADALPTELFPLALLNRITGTTSKL
jgi:hypothetical protein